MSFSVRWTLDAIESLQQNLAYLKANWPSAVEDDFLDRLDEIVKKIQSNPYLYSMHRAKDKIHKCVVHPRIVLYFKILNDSKIDLLIFWNTWQNPKALKV